MQEILEFLKLASYSLKKHNGDRIMSTPKQAMLEGKNNWKYHIKAVWSCYLWRWETERQYEKVVNTVSCIIICSYILNKITGNSPFSSIQTNALLWSLNYYNIYSSHVCRFINKLRISYRAIHIDFCDIHHVLKFKITASLQNQKSVTKVVL